MVPNMHPEPRIVKVGARELAVEDAGPDSGCPILMMNGAGSRHLSRRPYAKAKIRVSG